MFRFSIRDAMLLGPVLAVGFAWVCERGRLDATERQVIQLKMELQAMEDTLKAREAALEAKFSPLLDFPVKCGMVYIQRGDCCDPSLSPGSH